MAQQTAIKIRRSSVASKIPLTTDLVLGELALNTYDGVLYFKKSPNGTDSIVAVVTLDGTQTLTNKTLTSPTINSGALSGTFSGNTTLSGVITLSNTTDATNTTTAGTIVSGGLAVAKTIYADQIRVMNNGAGTNIYVGDDAIIGDVNAADTMSVRGQQNAANGYIIFGNANNTAYIGRSGSNPITVTGQFTVSSGTIASSTTASMQLNGYVQKGGAGYHDFLSTTNTYASATNPNKFFRLNSTGSLEIINSAYSANIFSLSDAGQLTVSSLVINGGSITAGGTTGSSGQILSSTGTGVQWITSSAGSSGTVTSVSVTSANGFAGTVANSTTTPAITLTTSITGLLKGNGTAISAATGGTDYISPSTTGQTITDTSGGTNYTLKIANGTTGAVFGIGTGNNAYGIANDALNNTISGYVPYTISASTITFKAGTVPATALSIASNGAVTIGTLAGLLKGTSGVISAATAGTDYLAPSGLSITTAAASGGGSLSYNSSTGVFTFTPPDLSTYITASSTTTFTNKTFDTAGTGNVFKINGTQVSAVTGSGSVVLATSPTLVTPTLGIASATSINKVTITAPATGSTLTIADGKTLTASNTLTFTGTDSSSVAFGAGGTVLYTTSTLTAGNLSGTIPSSVLGNSTVYIGTTAVALNRSSANLALTGISSVALAGSTSGTSTLQAQATAGTTTFTLPTTTGTLIGTGDSATVTNTMLVNPSFYIGTTSVSLGATSGSITSLAVNISGTAANLSGTQTANYVYAAPNGSNGTASFRALVAGDIPPVTNVAGGTTGAIHYQSAANTTTFLSGNTTTTPQFVTSTGTGSAAQAPTLTGSTGSGNVVLASNPTISSPTIAGGTIDNVIIGSTTPSVVNATNAIDKQLYLAGGNNLFQYSNALTTSPWFTTAESLTGSQSDPFGGSSAWLVTADGTATQHYLSQAIAYTSGSTYTTSWYLKAGTNNFAQLLFASAGFGTNAYANFNLSTGVLGTVGSSATATITSVGGGWYRCSMTATAIASASGNTLACFIASATDVRFPNYSTSNTFYAYGLQLELGNIASPYTATTSAAVTTTNNIYLGNGSLLGGSVATSAGLVSTGLFTGTYTDGIILDYDPANSNARISAGAGDGFTFYNSANTTRVSLLTVSSAGAVTLTSDLFGQATQNVFNTVSTTVNFAGAATTVSIGASTGTTTVNNNLTATGTVAANGASGITTTQTTFPLVNTTATTVNFAGAATAVNIGASTGTTTVNNNLTVTGNLDVKGTTTFVESTTVQVSDKNIEIGKVATPTDTTADGGGITLLGATNKTIIWDVTNNNWTSSENWNIASGKTFKINNVSVLSATALGSNVTGSSLTSVGTITSGTWNGSVVGPAYGGTGVNNGVNTLTLAGNVSHAGAYTQTFTATANTSVTLPTTGTLATLAGSETLTNKTISFGSNTITTTLAQLNTAITDDDVASVTHKYHSFTNNTYYYDSYQQDRYFRLFTENSQFDNARFVPIGVVEYYDQTSSAWVTWSGGASTIQNLFDGRHESYVDIDHTHRKFRFTITKNSGWPTGCLIAWYWTWFGNGWTPFTTTIEDSADLVTWTTKETLTFGNTTNTTADYGWHVFYSPNLHNGRTLTRVTVDITDWTDQTGYTAKRLNSFCMFSNYDGAAGTVGVPVTWDYNKTIYTKAGLSTADDTNGILSLGRYNSSDTNAYVDSYNASGMYLRVGYNPVIRLAKTTNSVNFLQIQGSVSGSAPSISSVGSDSNIDLYLSAKGTGKTTIGNSSGLQLLGTTGSTVLIASTTASGTLTLPATTDTLVGKATTDTLTNKTLSSAVITGTVTANGSTGTAGYVLSSTGTGVQWVAQSSGGSASFSPTAGSFDYWVASLIMG
jgi:hypothetical protein